jgi:hypothetical protein
MKNNTGGFIGLVALLISVAIIALIVVRTDLFSPAKEKKSMIEVGTDAIDEARNVKVLIEENNRKAVEN